MKRLLLSLILIVASVPAFATSLTWTGGGGDGMWATAANWSPAAVPQTGDDLTLDANATSTTNNLPASTVLLRVIAAAGDTINGSTIHITDRLGGGTTTIWNAPIATAGGTVGGGVFNGAIDFGTSDGNINYAVNPQTSVFNAPLSGSSATVRVHGTATFNADSPAFTSALIIERGSSGCQGDTAFYATIPASSTGVFCNTKGSGTVGPLVVNATFSPSTTTSAVGTFHSGNFRHIYQSVLNNGPFVVDINGSGAGTGYDQLQVTGTVWIDAPISVRTGSFTPAPGQSFVIVANDGSDPVDVNKHASPGTAWEEGATITASDSGRKFHITYAGGDGNDIVLTALGPATASATSSPNPSVSGQFITIDVAVTGSGSTPTGSVTFNGPHVITIPLNASGHAIYTTQLYAGNPGVCYAYNGDSNYASTQTQCVAQTVNKADTTTTVTQDSANQFLINARVEPVAPSQGFLNTGKVTPIINGVAQQPLTVPENSNLVQFALVNYPPGDYTVVAQYHDNFTFNDSASAPVTIHIRNTATMNVTPAPAIADQPFLVGVQVSGGSPTPTGTISIRNGSTLVGSGTLDGTGHANVNVSALPAGTYLLTAQYSGDGTYGALSSTFTQIVSDLRISTSDVSVVEGNSGTKTATVVVTLSSSGFANILVDYATEDGTALAGLDYQQTSGTLTFGPGETSKSISIPINGDTAAESDERFSVRLSNPRGAQLATSRAVVTIVNDDDAFTVVRDLEYANVNGTSLMLDLFLPVDGRVHPVIVGIDASDWNSPIRQTSVITREAGRGYAVALLSFRPASGAKMPAQIDDVKAAVRWLRANSARFNLDPSRFGAWGIGAGGHLAALLGVTNGEPVFDDPSLGNPAYPTHVRAIVDWYGPANLSTLATDSTVCGDIAAQITQLLGCSATSCPDAARNASPTTYVSHNDAAFLIMHGSADCNVPLSQSQALYNALRAANVDATLTVNETAGHGGTAWSNETLLKQVDAFFDRVLMPIPVRARSAHH